MQKSRLDVDKRERMKYYVYEKGELCHEQENKRRPW